MNSTKSTIITGLMFLLAAGAATAGELAPGLADRMAGMTDDEILKVLVVMNDPTDVRQMDKSLHEGRVPLAERHRTVIETLRGSAAAVQADFLADLDARIANKSAGSAGSGVVGYTPHWIINAVVVVADVATIREIAARPDVDVVEPDLEVELIEPVMTKSAYLPGDKSEEDPFIAPGVVAVNARRVWYELGITGAGTLVGNLDSGVDGSHPMLVDRWRGNTAPASEAWRDDAGLGYPDFPHDSHGHGSHTLGTITGATATDTVGVAPGAEWIASNGIYSSINQLDNAVIAAFEFFTDPDGDPATTDDVPDAIQNSWGVNESSTLGYAACDSRWWEVIDNCEAAGVVVLFSAGNEGPTPMSLRNPGNRASSPTNAFTVGSVGNSEPYGVSNFSSRGPSQCGGVHQIKPEVVAPGEDVLSCAPGGGYAYMSGTSMSGPHVAGIVALMREANPDLDVITIKEILMATAIDIGSSGEDNASGFGMVDAYEAVLSALNDVGTVVGTVTDLDSGLPLVGAEVTRPANGFQTNTDPGGEFRFSTRAGAIELEYDFFGYYPTTASGLVGQGETLVLDAALVPLPRSTVRGTVFGPDGEPVSGATVSVKDVPVAPVVSDAEGRYTLPLPQFEDAAYTLAATALDFAYETSSIGLDGDRDLDFHLPYLVAEGFETGTMTSFPWIHRGDAPMVIDATQAQEGVFSARSGLIRDGETSELSLDYYVNGEGELSFWVKTSSEEGFDGLIFYMDGVHEFSWSGEMDWTRFSMTIPEGQHHFMWQYVKDYGVSVGEDAAWIDRIEFPGTGVEPFPELVVDPPAVSLALNPGLVQTETLELSNTGGWRLDFIAGTNHPWVTAGPDSSWVHPGVSRDLELTFDTDGLDDGTYQAILEIESNDPAQPLTYVPLVLTVGQVSGVGDLQAAGAVDFIGAVPNPFNPMTHIAYSLAAESDVSLKIYDVSGRLVRDLVAGHRVAGLHRERWDGRDAAGQTVSSGVYFARLRAGGQVQLKQMLLLR